MTEIVVASRIRDLNDQFRRSLTGGMLVMTQGIIALGAKRQMAILSVIASFDGSVRARATALGRRGLGRV